ncbi:Ammonium transporter 1 member 1 [Hondaea fermentalgiana]|uniref:Ammonium transporter n=1 Tax=Hondaea fermentalgiana TaxID=2315210 RepID=A0A2R5GEP3_9STRA|nr:Ammonium transporter 1 member 1 [Hondaea fermentalgiana]|eukprot:GBG26284.1 Ammonium transporter 1 member 1 [Hondaea fermentalgiana]
MSSVNATELQERIVALESLVLAEDGSPIGFVTQSNADQIWVLLAGFLVFWMHAGFTMLEAGSVQHKNAINILFKNMGTVAIGAFFYYLFGYAWAYGTDNLIMENDIPQPNEGSFRFIGSGNYALNQETNETRHSWFFQAVFAATAATIVSGAVAGRINLLAYFATASVLTAFVYPVVSHWIWATGGWISMFQFDRADSIFADENGCGMIDFAGSGVVHMTGGIAAFWGALILGPRLGRFDADGKPVDIPPHNITIQALGVFILWFGWYGFNCGSTLVFDGPNASKVAVTTTLSPSTAILTSIVLSRFIAGHFDIGMVLNAALGGLVGITASCSVVDDWAAILIGFISAFVYVGGSKLVLFFKIDDPVDAIAVHGFCGIWGVLAAGIFSTNELIQSAYSSAEMCEGWGSPLQFRIQFIGVLAIISWVSAMMVPFYLALKAINFLRVSAEFEETGLDMSEHGGKSAYTGEPMTPQHESTKVTSDATTEEPLKVVTDTASDGSDSANEATMAQA